MKAIVYLFITIFVFAGCSKSELHESMESMGDSFKAMNKSEDLASIKAEATKFVEAQKIAQAQIVKPEDSDTFKEGMEKITNLVSELQTALAADDMDSVKSVLQQLKEVRKEFHDKLEVD